MKQIIELIELEIAKAFEQAGYGKELAKVTISNRPDLCEYQCNGAMAGAKTYHKAPNHDCRRCCSTYSGQLILCKSRVS